MNKNLNQSQAAGIILLFARSGDGPSLGHGRPLLCHPLIYSLVTMLLPASALWVGWGEPFPCLHSMLQSLSLLCFYQVYE